jgi:hypothetical protein
MAPQLQELATMLPGGTFITFTVRFMHLCFVTSVPAFIDPVKKAIAAATVRPETSRDASVRTPCEFGQVCFQSNKRGRPIYDDEGHMLLRSRM